MNGWTITKVFRANGKLTVADTIKRAIELYRKYTSPNEVEIVSVEQVQGSLGADGGALTVDVQDMERRHAGQLAKLTEELERLKLERKHVYVHQRFDKGYFDGDDAEAVSKLKVMAAKAVAGELGWTLAKASWTYCDVREETDGMWLDMGMYVQELPQEKYGQTLNKFLGLEDDREDNV